VAATRPRSHAGGVLFASSVWRGSHQAQIVFCPRRNGSRPLPSARFAGTKITQEYAELVAGMAYFWAWPLLTSTFVDSSTKRCPTPDFGVRAVTPLNQLVCFPIYCTEQRLNPCPNQDVVYGVGVLALDLSPVVIQVPDFGDRFWVLPGPSICVPTVLPILARCTVRRPASICLSARIGKARSRRNYQGFSRFDQCRIRHAACFSRRQPGRQQGRAERYSRNHDVPADGLRRAI